MSTDKDKRVMHALGETSNTGKINDAEPPRVYRRLHILTGLES